RLRRDEVSFYRPGEAEHQAAVGEDESTKKERSPAVWRGAGPHLHEVREESISAAPGVRRSAVASVHSEPAQGRTPPIPNHPRPERHPFSAREGYLPGGLQSRWSWYREVGADSTFARTTRLDRSTLPSPSSPVNP